MKPKTKERNDNDKLTRVCVECKSGEKTSEGVNDRQREVMV